MRMQCWERTYKQNNNKRNKLRRFKILVKLNRLNKKIYPFNKKSTYVQSVTRHIIVQCKQTVITYSAQNV